VKSVVKILLRKTTFVGIVVHFGVITIRAEDISCQLTKLLRSCVAVCSMLVFSEAQTFAAAERIVDFSETNDLSRGFRSTVTGSGSPGDWQIVQDDLPSVFSSITSKSITATRQPVLAQLSRDSTDEHFPLLIFDAQTFDDFKLATRFKIVDGRAEQMAGMAFRIQDEKNYYVVRASALGNTFRFYKFVNGQRSAPIGPELNISRGVWHDLAIHCEGNVISCFLNGQQVIPALTDNSFSRGKIGFWTKSDSVSYFGKTTIGYTPRQPPAQTIVNKVLRDNPRLLGLTIYALTRQEPPLRIVGSSDPAQIGQPGQAVEKDVIARDTIYYGKGRQSALVTFPLHDRNGEAVGAVRVTLDSFKGQTEKKCRSQSAFNCPPGGSKHAIRGRPGALR